MTGTSKLMSVPYALHVKIFENISDSEKITEGVNTGWRLIGQNSNYYGGIRESAVNCSCSVFDAVAQEATGIFSTVMSRSASAKGDCFAIMGSEASA